MNEAMKPDGLNVIAVLVIASFAIDRIAAGLLFVLSWVEPWAQVFPDPASLSDPVAAARTERKRKLVYFILAGGLCAVVLLMLPRFRVLAGLGFTTNPALDTFLTGLIVIGGSDRMADLLAKVPGVSGLDKLQSSPKPIEISGKLVLVDEDASRGVK